MKTFTLIGYWQDTFEVQWEFGEGDTPDQAVKAVMLKMKTQGYAIEDLQVIAVLEGRHVDAVGFSFTGDYGLTEKLTEPLTEADNEAFERDRRQPCSHTPECSDEGFKNNPSKREPDGGAEPGRGYPE